jgi:thymidylate synthase (FAD)
MIRINQSVETVKPCLAETVFISQLASILSVPYGNYQYDDDKVLKVIWSCVKRGHLSVLEHCNITLRCITNIGTYKDYTRHRHCAFTIESTSFVKYHEASVILSTDKLHQKTADAIDNILKEYVIYPTKIGRDLLPQCLAGTMIMTTNIREWRYIIGLRGDPNDNPLTNELRDKIWTCLSWNYPVFFPVPYKNTADNPMCIYNQWGDHLPCTLPNNDS